MEINELLAFINQRHGTSFRVVCSLAGGFQEGAWRVVDSFGEAAVLKPGRAERAIPIIQRLRKAGYPTPDMLFWGAASEGTDYHIQEFFSGRPLETLNPDVTRQLIALNGLQAGLVPDSAGLQGNWSEYACSVVFANESGWAACLRDYSEETARLLRDLERLSTPFADTQLSLNDAVHGDWAVGNFLAEQGGITGIVDCAAAGYGTRAVDLAALLHYAHADDYNTAQGGIVRDLLRIEILRIGDLPMLTILLAYRTMALVEFGIRRHDDEGVAASVKVGRKIVADLEERLF